MPHHARKEHHGFAQFPPLDKIPEAAHPDVEAFLKLRARRVDVQDQQREAQSALKHATEQDKAALDKHVMEGASASTFTYTHVEAAKKAIETARVDGDVLDRLLGAAYLKAVDSLQRDACMAEGRTIADQEVATAQSAYLAAIDQAQNARRAYLDAVARAYFWMHLDEENECVHAVGVDQFVLSRGPITRIDSHTFGAMRSDAQAHTRIDPKSQTQSTW